MNEIKSLGLSQFSILNRKNASSAIKSKLTLRGTECQSVILLNHLRILIPIALILAFSVIILSFLVAILTIASVNSYAFSLTSQPTGGQPINGVVMKGAIVNMKQHDNGSPQAPSNYIEDSLKRISEAGLDHARFLFYWEAYERDPNAFMKEIESVANAADKYGVKVIYDNHQWHTSSYLEDQGTGFPWSMFEGSKYSRGGGGNTADKAAQVFWADWWNRSVKDKHGNDGWTSMAEFLKKIVLTVDKHPSTLGYEILSEPHADKIDQWSKIGQFNSFITEKLRNITSKTIVYSMNIPVELNSPINITPENLAKMAPSNKENIAFKISVYGVPNRDAYQRERFDLFLKTRNLTGVPLYIGEWNNVVRTRDGGIFKIDPGQSEFTKSNAAQILGAFKKAGVWGTAFWKWDYRDADTTSFNLVSDSSGKLVPTKYFGILKDTVETVYGSSSLPENTNQAIHSLTTTPEVGLNASSMSTDTTNGGLSTSQVKSSSEPRTTSNNFQSSSVQDNNLKSTNTNNVPEVGLNASSMSTDTTNGGLSTSQVKSSSELRTTSNNFQSSSVQDNNLKPTNTNTKSPGSYDTFNDLVHDLKNHVIINQEFPLSAFQDSAAYKGADKPTQDCIRLAGLIGKSLTYREIVHCVQDASYFDNKLSLKKNNNNAIDTAN